MEQIVLALENVDIRFGDVHAVKNATLQIRKGEIFALVGESGSGKSTIGRAIVGINPCAAGRILYHGQPVGRGREMKRKIQMVFQDPAASLNERSTVEQIICEGLRNFHLYKSDGERRQKVERIMEEVGLLPEHLSRYPHEFSGGQRQRIGIARAMIMEPELVVADEPISALDVSVRAQVLNLMKRFQREHGTSFLFIAHDLSVVRYVADRIGVICKGRIVEVAEAEELFRHPLHPYTRSLLSAVPIPDPILERQKVLLTYDPSIHRSAEGVLTDIGHNHQVYGSPEEVQAYHAHRDRGEPLPDTLYPKPQPDNKKPSRPKSGWKFGKRV
ncbi:MAG: ABC transporter ATP-binding protein [Ruminococcaceae bacterium]|nr:ABC transporter ATP-binding protein [Oscillospiraceae bacterium]MBQ3215061.1 ABC transporter ATP-binding protein [Oscillospiraceae bacterium]